MTDMDDYLARKRDQLGMGRADELTTIQAALDSWYPGQARASIRAFCRSSLRARPLLAS
jgi:hypothetical protein